MSNDILDTRIAKVEEITKVMHGNIAAYAEQTRKLGNAHNDLERQVRQLQTSFSTETELSQQKAYRLTCLEEKQAGVHTMKAIKDMASTICVTLIIIACIFKWG